MNYELHMLNAEFFRTQFSIRHSQSSIATAPLFFHTACVCSEKNYRLQDIQLSKSAERIQPHSASHSLSLARGPAFAAFGSFGAQPSLGLPTVAHARVGKRERRLVENTGLEPVTSWLQTRRSPS